MSGGTKAVKCMVENYKETGAPKALKRMADILGRERAGREDWDLSCRA